jgi:hypothetical protein
VILSTPVIRAGQNFSPHKWAVTRLYQHQSSRHSQHPKILICNLWHIISAQYQSDDECLKMVSFAVHPNMRSHIGASMSLGKGSVVSMSNTQKLNTWSSTEASVLMMLCPVSSGPDTSFKRKGMTHNPRLYFRTIKALSSLKTTALPRVANALDTLISYTTSLWTMLKRMKSTLNIAPRKRWLEISSPSLFRVPFSTNFTLVSQ